MSDGFKICSDCFSNEDIVQIINDKGYIIDSCDFCNRQLVLGVDDEEFDEVKTYIDCYTVYHYDEKYYDSRYGIQSSYATYEENNDFFVWDNLKKCAQFPDLVDCMCDRFSNEILVNSKHGAFEKAIKSTKVTNNLNEIRAEGNYQKKIFQINKILDLVSDDFLPTTENLLLYRARVGYDEDATNYNWYEPYTGKDIGVAPIGAAGPGRANREYWSFLYLAEDIETAMLEVRPHLTDYVSVGKFENKEQLNLFNLASPNIRKYAKSYESMQNLENLASINNLFQEPVNSNGKSIYLETQLFTEQIALRGYDGICFTSSLTGKLNYTIFVPEKFEYIDKSSKLYEVNKINLGFREFDFFRKYG